MKYMLITTRNVIKTEIITEIFDTKEEAYNKMKTALYNRLKMDGDEKFITILEDGAELSNAILNENDAYIFQNFGDTSHHWKIVEISSISNDDIKNAIKREREKTIDELANRVKTQLEVWYDTNYKLGSTGRGDDESWGKSKAYKNAIDLINEIAKQIKESVL